MFLLRFDMRSATPEHYRAAIDMVRWGEDHGALAVAVSEHHASDDGFLPAPLMLASAMAAVTSSIPIQVAALLVPLYDPIALAESMAVLDRISAGRVSYICGAGYRPEEFELYGQDFAQRGARLEAMIPVLRQAWTGEPFEFEGRQCRVTPTPSTPGGPLLVLGGGTPAAVRRAVRLGMGMMTERNAGLEARYQQACAEAGVEPQIFFEAPKNLISAAFVAEDPDAFWDLIGDHVLSDARSYRAWNEGRPLPESVTMDDSVEAIRAAGLPYRVFTPDEAVDHIRRDGFLNLHPLCGGLPVDVAWSSLELIASSVLPRL